MCSVVRACWRVVLDVAMLDTPDVDATCVRCRGTGTEPTMAEVGCVRCDATGNASPVVDRAVMWSEQYQRRVALGEFRRRSP